MFRFEGKKRFSRGKVKGHDRDIPLQYFEIVIKRKGGGGRGPNTNCYLSGKKGRRRGEDETWRNP